MSSTYFATFTTFTLNPNAQVLSEFGRLARQQGWGKKSARYRRERLRMLRCEFGMRYGRDGDKLAGWHLLCQDVGIEDVPSSIKGCRQVLKRTWVNLVDLTICQLSGSQVHQFNSREELREYTIRTGKIFPKKEAHRDGFLDALLIQLQ